MEDRAKNLKTLVENVANSGLVELDKEDLKGIKKICKCDGDSIPYIYDLLMKQMKRKHSQVRLSCFQLTHELFQRSHAFRELVVHRLHELIDLVMETDSCNPLPLPKEARDRLKKLSLDTLKEWVQKFGTGYQKLNLAFNYLKQVRKVDFNDMQARSDLEIRQEEEAKRKMDNIWKERVKKVKVEMEENRSDIEDCLVQMDNCFNLLIPDPEKFEFCEEDKNASESEEEVDVESEKRVHGIVSSREMISISMASLEGASKIEETKDNSAVMESLRDQCTLLKNRFLPLVKKWSVTLTKAGDVGDSDTLKKVIDVKQLLEGAEEKAVSSFDMFSTIKAKTTMNTSDTDDDDDFVEVEVKSGYEEHAFSTALSYDDPKPSTSGLQRIATGQPGSLFNENKKKASSNSSAPPVIDFDPERKPLKVAIDPEKLRFWGAGSLEEGEMTVPGSDSNQRTIEFAGTFEPVTWSCRAPLPSGKLCPRFDRLKCPLHGRIVPRDNMGQPAKLEDRLAEEAAREKKNAENPEWQDPELLRDIKHATGIDLKMPKKGAKRFQKKTQKYPGLKAIKAEENTTRKRLQKKIFSRSAMKKVAETLNKADALRHKDKFADQFNYLFTR